MTDQPDCGFVADGHQRACDALGPMVREEVKREYAARLENASLTERARLRLEMASEIERRIDAQAPQDALY